MKSFNLVTKALCISLSSVALLSACGGGDSAEPTPPSQPSQPTQPASPPTSLVGHDNQAAFYSISSIDSLVQLAFLAQHSMQINRLETSTREISCVNGGIYEISLTDNDSSNTMSEGDRLTYMYRECYLDSLGDFAEGTVDYDILALDTNDKFTVNMDVSELTVGGAIHLDGAFTVTHQRVENRDTLSIETLGDVDLNYIGDHALTFIDLGITKINDYETAKYQVEANGRIFDVELDGEYRLTQQKAFTGYFNEYPNDGELRISASESDFVIVEANFVAENEYLDVTYKDSEYTISWDQTIEGALLAVGLKVPDYPVSYRSDNFEFIGALNESALKNLGLNESIEFIFSRPVESITPVYGEVVFSSNNFPYEDILAEVNLSGAIVKITPQRALDADTRYDIRGFEALSSNGQTLSLYLPAVYTSDEIVPVVSAQSGMYRHNDTPILSAGESINNSSGELSFAWREASDAGVVFVNENAAETTFTVPESTIDTIEIEVTMTASTGYAVTETVELKYIPAMTTMLSYSSPAGDYIGGGESKIFDESDGEFLFSPRAGNEGYVGMRFNGDVLWTLDLAAPSGDTLSAGIYEGATRYPFQSPTAPGLSFTGDGRGCNQSSGRFEIFEIAYNASGELDKLAVDFEQSCENIDPSLKGIVRYNSTAPLNN